MRAYRKDTLDEDHEPSFLVDTDKDLFYCYGCDRGGDVIRFAELYHQVKFSEAKKTN
jgi:DNA primase